MNTLFFFIGLIICFCLIKYLFSSNKDNSDSENEQLYEKISFFSDSINKSLFNSKGKITYTSKTSLVLNVSEVEPKQYDVLIEYSRGYLSVTCLFYTLDVEVKYKKNFAYLRKETRDIQLKMADSLMLEFVTEIEKRADELEREAFILIGLGKNGTPKIRDNGYYIYNYNGLNYYGENVTFSILLIFNNLNHVLTVEIPEHPNTNDQEFKKLIMETIQDFTSAQNLDDKLSTEVGKYSLTNGNKIEIIFFDPNDLFNKDRLDAEIYNIYSGTLMNNYMMLNLDMSTYNSIERKIKKTNVFNNAKFIFNQVELT